MEDVMEKKTDNEMEITVLGPRPAKHAGSLRFAARRQQSEEEPRL